MKEDIKKLSGEEMEKASGGVFSLLRGEPHCPSCSNRVLFASGAYRCANPNCDKFAKPMTKDDVEWF